jgi:hypothetical protein
MQFHTFQSTRAALLFGAVAAMCATSVSAQDASTSRLGHATSPLAAAPRSSHDHVLYDEPGDGALWVMGTNYKASFGRDGASFIPAFGSSAPKNYPHALSPDRVTVGGVPIAFQGSTSAQRTGDRVVMQRGAFVERYDLALESLEQSFVFESLPRAGALVLHIPVASELEGSESANGLEFTSDFGTLTYSRAVAIDALGRRFDAPTHLVDGAIQIEVAAADLAAATLPLVIDPVIGTLYANLTGDDLRNTDSAWDNFNGCWLVTWSKAFSATDNDVYGRTITPFGFSDSTVDVTGASWNVPRCAQLASVHQYLVVASVVSGNNVSIMGRTLQPSGSINVLGSQFGISGADTGAMTNPDVGGDSVSDSTTSYCVVWERLDPVNFTTHIACRLVSSSSVPLGASSTYITASNPFWSSVLPTVSKSGNGLEWLIAYTFNDPLNHADTWAARMAVTGSLIGTTFQVTAGIGWETQPVASSYQGNTSRAMIAYKYRTTATGQNDIWVSVLDGATVIAGANLTALENSGFQSMDQKDPAIDCDGQHFVVAYSEYDPNFVTWDVFADDIALAGNTVQLTQSHVPVQPYGLSEYRSQVAAARNTTNAPSHRYCISWDFRENDTDYDVIFKTFDALEGGTSGSFCFGDGSGTACPCGNTGGAQRGCASSGNILGARLTLLSGTVSTLNDTAVLGASSMPVGTACLFFQGTTLDAGTPFGDGLLCATGAITRLAVKFAPSGSATYPAAGDPSLTTAGAIPTSGGSRSYQVWYRDAAAFCTSATYNLTNGSFINWAR